MPVDEDEGEMVRAREALFERLKSQPVMNAGRWTREELYDRDQ